jgi:hypothetical protein
MILSELDFIVSNARVEVVAWIQSHMADDKYSKDNLNALGTSRAHCSTPIQSEELFWSELQSSMKDLSSIVQAMTDMKECVAGDALPKPSAS